MSLQVGFEVSEAQARSSPSLSRACGEDVSSALLDRVCLSGALPSTMTDMEPSSETVSKALNKCFLLYVTLATASLHGNKKVNKGLERWLGG